MFSKVKPFVATINKLSCLTFIILLTQGCASSPLKRSEGIANLNTTPAISKNFENVFTEISDDFIATYPTSIIHQTGKVITSPAMTDYLSPYEFAEDIELQEILNSSCIGTFRREEVGTQDGYGVMFNKHFNPVDKVGEAYFDEIDKHKYTKDRTLLSLETMHKKQLINLLNYNNSHEFNKLYTNSKDIYYGLDDKNSELIAFIKRKIKDTKIKGTIEPIVAYYCFNNTNNFEIITLGQLTYRGNNHNNSSQFVGYFNQDDFKLDIIEHTNIYIAAVKQKEIKEKQKVIQKKVAKQNRLAKIETDKKEIKKYEQWNKHQKSLWDNRLYASYKPGNSVCTYDNKMAFVEQDTPTKVKVLIKGKLEKRYSIGYFFGNQTKYEHDNSFNYQPKESMTWLPKNKVAHCNFDL